MALMNANALNETFQTKCTKRIKRTFRLSDLVGKAKTGNKGKARARARARQGQGQGQGKGKARARPSPTIGLKIFLLWPKKTLDNVEQILYIGVARLGTFFENFEQSGLG